MSLFLPYLLLTLGVLVLSYVLGRLLLGRGAGLGSTEPYFATFAATLVGVSVLTVGYATVRAGGNTVLLPVLVLLGVLGWRSRRAAPPVVAVPAGPSVWGASLGLAVAVYAVRYLLLYDPASPFPRTPFQDYLFYARISGTMNQTGIEGTVLETVYPQFQTVQPYHYFELWLNALLVKLTGLPSLWCLYLGAYTALIVLVGLGLRAVMAHFRLASGWAWGLTALLLLVSGVCWPFFARYPLTANGQLVASSLLLLEPKLAPVYVFLLLGTLLLLRRQYTWAGLVLATLPLVYVSTAPAIGGSLVALAAYLLYTRQARPADVLRLLAPIMLVVLYFAVFYLVQPKPFQLTEPDANLANEVLPKVSEAKTLVNILIGTLLNYALYFGAYVVVCAIVFTRRGSLPQWLALKPLLVWSLTLALAGAVMRTLATHFSDGYQFSANVVAPLVPVLLAVLLGAAYAVVGEGRRWAATALLAGLCLVNYYPLLRGNHSMHKTTRYSPAFLRQVQAVVPPTGARASFLFADADYENMYMLSEDTYSAGTYLGNFANSYDIPTLSTFTTDSLGSDPRYARDSAQARQRLHSGSLYRTMRLAPPRQGTPIDSVQYCFVVRNGIQFICASARAVLPSTLRPLVRQELVDPVSGEKLYVLKSAPALPSASVSDGQ